MLPILISALIFIVVSLVIGIILRPRAASVHERIDDYLLSSPPPIRQEELPSFAERVLIPALRALGRAIAPITPTGALEKTRAKLDMAGNPRNFGVLEYYGTKVLSAALLIPLGIWFFLHVQIQPVFIAWVIVGVIIGLGIWLPDIILQRIIEARQASIRRSLPDVLDLLVVSVEAGVGFDGAVQKVVEKATGPLSMELARVLEQIRLGQSRGEALREMGRRTQVQDLISFVAAVTQAETLGVSIAKVLRTQADTARGRRAQRAREAAAKLPVKLLFPLVFFIFPSLFVVILGPGVIRFIDLFKVLGK
jgi:tight adherence protein C